MSDIELDELKPRGTAPEEDHNDPDGVLSAWATTAAVLLSATAACFVLSPRLLLFASQTDALDLRTSLTSLEQFLATHFGIWLAAIAITLIPGRAPISRADVNPSHPLLAPVTLAASVSALLSYNSYFSEHALTRVGALAFFVFVASAIVALWGFWAMVFASEGLVSNKTGADKRTSAFLFGNRAAASKQKKEWKLRQSTKKDI